MSEERTHPLDTARGFARGCAISLVIWGIIIAGAIIAWLLG